MKPIKLTLTLGSLYLLWPIFYTAATIVSHHDLTAPINTVMLSIFTVSVSLIFYFIALCSISDSLDYELTIIRAFISKILDYEWPKYRGRNL